MRHLFTSRAAVFALALLTAGSVPAWAQSNKKPAPKPSTKPAPAKPAPAKPAPAPAKPPAAPGVTPQTPQQPPLTPAQEAARAKALTRAIDTQEKSDRAGEAMRKFIEGTLEEKLSVVLDPEKNGQAVKDYFTTGANKDFKPTGIQILGAVTPPSAPDKAHFPYFVATDKNKLGFVTVVVETAKGYRVDASTFMKGQDQNLETFISDKKAGAPATFLVGIAKTHIFGTAPTGGEAKWDAYSIDMPPPRIDQDPPTVFVEKASEIGKTLSSKLGWSRGHLCLLSLAYEGAKSPYLKITAYQPYAK